jgi:hypothetical protein
MPGNLKLKADASAPATEIVLWLATPDAAHAFRADALGAADRLRYERIRSERRRRDFQVSRALLQRLGAPGTPSLSHSGGYACAAHIKASAAPDCAIGVDLEAHQPRDEVKLARFAFSEAELHSIVERTARQQEDRFYALWTLKEAAAKAIRAPLPDALRRCVFVHAGEWRSQIPTNAPYSLTVFQPRPALTLAVALIGAGSLSVEMQEWPSGAPGRWPVIAQMSRDHPRDPYPPEGAGARARAPRATTP